MAREMGDSMHSGLRHLLAGVIDYAGLFPPARLPLEQAIRNYFRYRSQPDNWMLGRFVCPAARLTELTPFVEVDRSGPPFAVSVLGRGGKDTNDFLTNLRTDLDALLAFREHHGARVVVDILEMPLPLDAVRDVPFEEQWTAELAPAALAPLLVGAARLLDSWTVPALFYEAPAPTQTQPWPSRVNVIEMLAEPDAAPRGRKNGYKLRCGGLEASAFPSVEQVAFVVARCRDAGVPLKATAGLHHPLRHFDSTLKTPMHGFVNLFVGSVLAERHRLTEDRIGPILADEDAASFAFDDDGLSWRGLRASVDRIRWCRAHRITSFGSCSFDEPRQDLRALGWL
jgi:hypothetical protein